MEHHVWSKEQYEDARDLLMWYRVNFLDEELIELQDQQVHLYHQGRFEEAGEKFNEFMLLAIELGLVRNGHEMAELPEYLAEEIDEIISQAGE